jgi:alkanesulfonate monooxygenase SsuD/methylene tetrahydromethanopterin reductase-like flavin-dependent oxidoreductase (luciferase family)
MDNPPLRFGIAPPNWGVFGNPHHAAELASVAERAGWHGYFTWDGLPVKDNPPPIYDPWVILASVAAATELIRIGTCVAVVPRYKPHFAGDAGSPAAPGWGRLPVRCLRCG